MGIVEIIAILIVLTGVGILLLITSKGHPLRRIWGIVITVVAELALIGIILFVLFFTKFMFKALL